MRAVTLLVCCVALAAEAGVLSGLEAVRCALRAVGASPVGGSVKASKGPRLQVSGCSKVAPGKWAGLLLLNEPIEHEYHFSPGCDLEGKVVFRRTGFPVDLRVRNLPGADRVKAQVRLESEPELSSGTVKVNVFVSGLKLLEHEREWLAGESNYNLVMDLAGDVKANRGGAFQLARYSGRPASGTVHYTYRFK